MSPSEVEELCQKLRDLTERVDRLEAALAARHDALLLSGMAPPKDLPAAANRGGEQFLSLPGATPVLPVLGFATLGLAGAYLLRAIAESGIVPAKIALAAGTLYAVAWLLWAPRARAGRRLAPVLYSLTASLILSPLLWEATVRFHTLAPWQTSMILFAFTLIGLAVSWHSDLLTVATISALAGIGTAGALLIATYDVLPFAFVFLGIAAAVETCACFNHWLGERWLAAVAADLVVILATWLVTNPRGLPEGYAPISTTALFVAQMVLLVIYLSSVMVRTLAHGRTFTNFETVQCACAFVIGVGGALRLASEGSRLSATLAGFALLCGAACYAISFKVLAQESSQGRNFYTYSTFAILLVLAGCRILLSDRGAAAAWILVALACIGAGGYWAKFTLEVHGGFYLLLALLLSGALRQSTRFLLGSEPWATAIPQALCLGAAAAAAGYVLARRCWRCMEGGWKLHAFRVAMAATMVWLALGLASASLTGIYHGLFAAAIGDSFCATLRTGAVVAVSLLLAAIGSRVEFRDLAQLVYPLMLLGGYRLLIDDLRQGRKSTLFLSLLLYGATLIALPRLRRARANS